MQVEEGAHTSNANADKESPRRQHVKHALWLTLPVRPRRQSSEDDENNGGNEE